MKKIRWLRALTDWLKYLWNGGEEGEKMREKLGHLPAFDAKAHRSGPDEWRRQGLF